MDETINPIVSVMGSPDQPAGIGQSSDTDRPSRDEQASGVNGPLKVDKSTYIKQPPDTEQKLQQAKQEKTFAVTLGLIGIFAGAAGFSLGFEELIYQWIISACKDEDWYAPFQRAVVYLFSIVSLIVLGVSLVVLYFAMMSFHKSLCEALKAYKDKHRSGPPTEGDKELIQANFFNYVVKEAVAVAIAITAIIKLGRNPEERKKVPDACNGNRLETLAGIVELSNDLYGYWAIFFITATLVQCFFVFLGWLFNDLKKHTLICFIKHRGFGMGCSCPIKENPAQTQADLQISEIVHPLSRIPNLSDTSKKRSNTGDRCLF